MSLSTQHTNQSKELQRELESTRNKIIHYKIKIAKHERLLQGGRNIDNSHRAIIEAYKHFIAEYSYICVQLRDKIAEHFEDINDSRLTKK